MLYAAHLESDENVGCAPKGIVFVVSSASLTRRSSLLRFVRVIP